MTSEPHTQGSWWMRWMEIADARAARMSEAFRDIIALCDTVITRRPDATEEDWVQLLARIDDIAHRGLYGKSE